MPMPPVYTLIAFMPKTSVSTLPLKNMLHRGAKYREPTVYAMNYPSANYYTALRTAQ